MNNIALKLSDVAKVYYQGDNQLQVLKNINLELELGTTTALIGSSGSGKSTLLHIAGLLDKPSSGKILLNGQDTVSFSTNQKATLRGQYIGFVYQFHHLLPDFTALENIMMPLLIKGVLVKDAEKEANKYIKLLKLQSRSHHRPAQLSGGEQQRIAILRALVNRPKIILADEPTGNLDEMTATQVFKELIDLVRSEKISALIATHDTGLSQKMDRIIRLKGGQIYTH